MVIAMTIVNVGVSHRFAPAETLEKLAVPLAELGEVLPRLHAVPSVDEVAVLCTCNRVEVYAATSGQAGEVTRAVAGLLAARGRLPLGEVLPVARTRVGGAAAEHLFSVACGLDSMAVGEEQIVAQIKAAARVAAAAGTTGPAITGLIDAALRASKRARTQTTISTEGISLARAGLDIAAEHLGGLAARHAVVLGTGSTGKLAARLLREAGCRATVSGQPQRGASRRGSRGVAGHARAGQRRARRAGRRRPAGHRHRSRRARRGGRAGPSGQGQGRGRPLFVLDLGMPPDVDAAVGRLAGVTLVDLTALGRHLADRAVPDQVPQVRAIVAAEAAAYMERRGQAAAAPVIAAMHAQITQLADAELARLHAPAAVPQRSATGRDRGHRPPHPPQGPAPADRPGQGVLHRPGRADVPGRA